MPVIEHFDPYDGELGFALATRVDDIVHVAGMTGVNEADRSAPEGLEAQLRLAYQNISTILDHFKTSLDHAIEQVIFFVGDEKEAVEVYDRVYRFEIDNGGSVLSGDFAEVMKRSGSGHVVKGMPQVSWAETCLGRQRVRRIVTWGT